MFDNIEDFLKVIEPLFFYVIITLVLVILVKNGSNILSFIKQSFSKRQRLLLLGTLAGLTLLVSLIAPKQERILYDEDIYINNAQHIVNFGTNEYCTNGEFVYGEYKCDKTIVNKQPPGYALTLSLPFRVLNVTRLNAFLFNNFVFLINAVLIFFTIFKITKRYSASLFSIVLYSFVPIVAHWHNSAASEPTTSVYVMGTLLSFLIFKDTKRVSHFFIGVLCFLLSFYIRFEMILLAIPIGYLLLRMLLKKPSFRAEDIHKMIWILTFGLVLALPIVLHFLHFRSDPWGAVDQATISTSYFVNNFNTNINFFLQNKEFPLIALFALVGIFLSKKSFPVEYFGLSFILLFGVYLFFYAGSYEYGADIRYALNSLSPFIVLIGISISVLMEKLGERPVLLLVIVPILFNATMMIPHMKYRGEEGWQAVWDLEFIRDEVKPRMDEDDYIYTNTPYTYHIYGLNGRSTDTLYKEDEIRSLLISHPDRKYYFHFGYWCSLDPAPGTVAYFCQNTALADFELELVVEKDRKGTHYALYEIVGVK